MNNKEKEKLKLLLELIKGSRRSDRELAKVLKTSQPTITRKRAALEREGYIKEYTIVPDLEKMGYEIIAFSFLAFSETTPDLEKKAREWCKDQTCIIYASGGEGLGMHSIMVSAHKDYSSYSKLITELREDWQPNLKDVQSFLIGSSRKELEYKPFSFKYCEPIEE
ncbi:MAG TPA: Lrp/AsnC family transcriptional regulator [Candidatus Bathyarchaeia archaeon]|nr:Lrp/AsnC family transcriptional regulator [Candidatus Bathyarchaeia archaeon]